MNKAHQFTGLADWIEVFKAGTHTDSKGRSCTFTEGDLDQMVSNLALGAAPAVLGHPKHNDPAYGWVKPEGAKREGASLFVKFDDINPAFAAGVDSGAYRNRSVSIFKDKDAGWRLQHVGWLGAARPAIDGLAPLDYSAAVDAYEFDADDWDIGSALGDTADLLRGLREQLIAKEGLEAADAALPSWRIQSVADAAQRVKTAALAEPDESDPSPFSKPTPTGGVMSFTQEQLDAATAQAKKEAQDKAAAEFAASQAELTKLRSERQADRIGAQINGWKAKGLVTPAEEAGLAEFMGSLESGAGAEFSFSASDKSQVKKTPAQFFADFMAARKPLVKLGQQVVADELPGVNGNDASSLADAARSYMKEQAEQGLTVSVAEAVSYVSSRTGAV
ncbi:hypothetical protein [Rhodoferax sp.]|uniref:hypothetical protein n=1 Tax=Rhodoferax sp. TaxID=50421 RepID=UPI00283E822E|nr:hypothetical protein [Rhodoferax sp.]MDR3370709.1 hypothetical protein [Rhodoferax sp.]